MIGLYVHFFVGFIQSKMCAAVAPRAKCLPSWCKVDEPEFVDGEVLLVQYVIVPDYDDVYYFSEVDLLVTYVHLAVSVVSPSSGRMRGVAATPKEAVYIVRMTTGAVRKDDIRTYVHEGKISDPYDGDMPRRSRAFIKSIMLPVPEEPVQTTFSLGTGVLQLTDDDRCTLLLNK